MRSRLPLLAICLGYFMVILDVTIVNVALPDMRADLGASVAGLQWVVAGYMLAFAALLLSGGALSDRLGARRVFIVGLAVFTVASAICAAAPGAGVLVAARVLQGVGAAAMVPASLALLRATYPDPAGHARAVGVWGSVAGIGAASGPVLGGALVQVFGWRAVFVVNVPIGILAVAATLATVPAPAPDTRRGFAPRAQLAAVIVLAALTVALIEAGPAGVGSLVVLCAVAVVLVGLGALVVVEHRGTARLLPSGLLARRAFSGATSIGLLINFGFYGQLFVMNLYFQQVRGYSALQAGLAVLPQAALVAAASLVSGRLTAARGTPRPAMLVGLVAGGTGLLGLLAAGADTPYVVLLTPLMAVGFGMSFTMPAATTAAVAAAPESQAGIAAAVINTARQVGGVIGVALLGALVSGPGFVAGLHLAMVLAAAVFYAGAVIALRTSTRGREAASR